MLIGVVGLLQAFRGGGWGSAILGILSMGFGLYVLGNVVLPFGIVAWLAGLLAIIGGALSIYFALTLNHNDEAGDAESSGNPLLAVFRIAAFLVVLIY